MPTPGAGIYNIGIVYETIATDKIKNYGTTLLNGFSIVFEMNAADKRYYEITLINGFGVEFEPSLLYFEEIYSKQV